MFAAVVQMSGQLLTTRSDWRELARFVHFSDGVMVLYEDKIGRSEDICKELIFNAYVSPPFPVDECHVLRCHVNILDSPRLRSYH